MPNLFFTIKNSLQNFGSFALQFQGKLRQLMEEIQEHYFVKVAEGQIQLVIVE
jgi:hypothetical protein